MARIFMLLFLLCPALVFSQIDLKKIARNSHQTLAYRVGATQAEHFIKKDSIDVDAFLGQTPIATFPTDSVDQRALPPGQYVLLSIVDNRIVANLIGISDFTVYPVNNQKRVQLLVIGKDGNFVPDAKVWVNGVEALYHADAKSYWVKQKKPEDMLIRVYTPHDTLFSSLSVPDELEHSVFRQRIGIFKKTWLGRTFLFFPHEISTLLKKKYPSSSAHTTGMIVFNQPKYKQTDTVKLKAYVFNKKLKFYHQPVKIFLEYADAGKYIKTFLKDLAPASPGSYIFQFPLSDTLRSDIAYSVIFETPAGKHILSRLFRIEDYLLDEISSYHLRSDKDTYYPGDSLRLHASALNANGLPVLDAAATLTITTSNINKFYPDTLYIPDTLFAENKALLTTGETGFDLASADFPKADLSLKANIEFRNGNNELQDKDLSLDYKIADNEFSAFEEKDSVVALFRENGKIRAASGFVRIGNDWNELRQVHYPFRIKIDPLAASYSFYRVDDGSIVDSATPDLEKRYEIDLTRISREDTLGFILENPYAIPVSFTVFDGNKIIGAGMSSGERVKWTTIVPNQRHGYRVSWQYQWQGEEQIHEKYIALLYKLLDIRVKADSTVFPGQTDSIAVQVRDYRNRPVPGVNLTALSYNSQFNKSIDVPEPPYLAKYKMRPGIKRDKFDPDDPYIRKKYPLGEHSGWRHPFRLDTMLYYQMHFPENGMLDVFTPIGEFLPQLSVHVVQRGERKEIYLLYINRNLVYYNGVTEKMNDAYQTDLGYTQIGIRLRDRFIEIDSIYTQPFYKHDLFVDLDKLPAHADVTPLKPVLTDRERSLLENQLWSLDEYRTNEAWVWQSEKLVRLSGINAHIVGPFMANDSLHYFAPGNFDIHFVFEPGYRYNLSKKILRLEKKRIFPDDKAPVVLSLLPEPEWVLGDTIPATPVIAYETTPRKRQPYLELSDYDRYGAGNGDNGKLFFTAAKDTDIRYIILIPSGPAISSGPPIPSVTATSSGPSGPKLVFPGDLRLIHNIRPGEYTMLLVDRAVNTAEIKHLVIRAAQTLCIHTDHAPYRTDDPRVTAWIYQAEHPYIHTEPQPMTSRPEPADNMPDYRPGSARITGRVLDKEGKHGVPGASVTIRGLQTGVATNSNGDFVITHIAPGKYKLKIASIGYTIKEVTVDVPDDGSANIDISLTLASQYLNDVVVIGYGTITKRDVTGSITTIRAGELYATPSFNYLQGRVAGVYIRQDDLTDSSRVRIRGMASISSGRQPIYVIDGIVYDKMPDNISPEMIKSINTLTGDEATAIYGSRGAEGVIVITTGAKELRTQFRDYAFWKPELFTDKDGVSRFPVTYPDNITGWQTFVLGMDKKGRMGKASSFTSAYKPLMAQLEMPQFLIAGDTASILGKALNYSKDDYSLRIGFSIDGQQAMEEPALLKALASSIRKYPVTARSGDSLAAAFTIRSNTGFRDGEEKKIPILPKGTLEANGQFWVLDKDTTIEYRPAPHGDGIECYAQNNTLDILLNEIDQLKRYPHYCMEQTASKLRGLLMEKTIRERLKQPFKDQKTIDFLIARLQKNQSYEGGWSWWENGKPDLFITNYVVRALLPIRSQGMIEMNIRNGLLFLQNKLPSLNKEELLMTLLTMSEARHLMNYELLLNKISFDSLNTDEQWKFVETLQGQNIDHAVELKKLMNKAIPGMLGGLHWGEENYRWYSDADATTVTAFEVLQKEKDHGQALKAIAQYFLERRRTGFWRNTVVSASIVSALLPYALSVNDDFNRPGVINISGDTSFSIREFPFRLVMRNGDIHRLNIQKEGGGLSYLTFYQQVWNNDPKPVSSSFSIDSHFERDNKKIATLNAGEKIKMIVDINALQEADYIMIEIPIPAGCTYGSKEQGNWSEHREFLKNKTIIFAEKLTKGNHRYELELESRYDGRYTLNPAKASLMYFPTFYGRNDSQSITIRP
jgi:TonB-dependent SusC/RagA subfamily outer membrane receptor